MELKLPIPISDHRDSIVSGEPGTVAVLYLIRLDAVGVVQAITARMQTSEVPEK